MMFSLLDRAFERNARRKRGDPFSETAGRKGSPNRVSCRPGELLISAPTRERQAGAACIFFHSFFVYEFNKARSKL